MKRAPVPQSDSASAGARRELRGTDLREFAGNLHTAAAHIQRAMLFWKRIARKVRPATDTAAADDRAPERWTCGLGPRGVRNDQGA